MPEEKDHLSNEVAVGGSLSIKGVELGSLSAGARSRTASSIDRLVGAAVDVGSAYLEGVARRRRAKDLVQTELVQAEGKAAIALAFGDPQFGERLANRFLADQARKQVNREAVADSAIEHLQEADDPGVDNGAIDEDWMNLFEAGAEKASSDHLRDLWGRVLAGEIRTPGSFSLSTIRFISELDAKIAKTFELYVSKRISDDNIIKPNEIVNDVLEDLVFLEACGLLQGALGNIGKEFAKGEDGDYFYIPMDNYLLRIKSKRTKLRLNVIYITRIGSEIASILPPVNPVDSLTAIGESFLNVSIESIISEVQKKNADGSILMRKIKVLKHEEVGP